MAEFAAQPVRASKFVEAKRAEHLSDGAANRPFAAGLFQSVTLDQKDGRSWDPSGSLYGFSEALRTRRLPLVNFNCLP